MSKIIEWIRNKVIGDDETIITKERLEELETKEELLLERMKATARIIELPEETPTKQKIKDKPKTKTTKRTPPKIIWTDSNGKGTIRLYKDGALRYYHYDPNQTPPQIMVGSDKQTLLKFAQLFMQNRYDHTQIKQIKECVGIQINNGRFNEDEERPNRYIYGKSGKYQIEKYVNTTRYCFGTWGSLQEARQVRDWFEEQNWPLNLSTNITYDRAESYRKKIREKMGEQEHEPKELLSGQHIRNSRMEFKRSNSTLV